MKERPILFSGPMVRAILAGRKTQTRRVVKHINPHTVRVVEKDANKYICHTAKDRAQAASVLGRHFEARGPVCLDRPDPKESAYHTIDCPYGAPGDRLWVRETWASTEQAGNHATDSSIVFRATDPEWGTEIEGWRWRPSIFMPRWASRITLEVVNIRVERLQDISEDDAKAEGVEAPLALSGRLYHLGCEPRHAGCRAPTWAVGFRSLWESINGPESWDANPWVWVVEFRKIEPTES